MPQKRSVRSTFKAAINRITGAESECAVDWNELERYETIFRETQSYSFEESSDEIKIETFVGLDGCGAIHYFERTIAIGQTRELKHAIISNGIDESFLAVAEEGTPPHRVRFVVSLDPLDGDDLRWTMSKWTVTKAWRNKNTTGIPLCHVRCNDAGPLQKMISKLRDAGVARTPPPPDLSDLPPELQASLQRQCDDSVRRFQAMIDPQTDMIDPSRLPTQGQIADYLAERLQEYETNPPDFSNLPPDDQELLSQVQKRIEDQLRAIKVRHELKQSGQQTDSPDLDQPAK